MIKRKVTKKIETWYKNNDSSLLIDGARQIGKTTAIRMFLNDNNIDYVEINLLENKLALEAFNTSCDTEQLLIRLTSLANKNLNKHETVFFIDEIQEADDAITVIKFLSQDKSYRYIFSGSLLGIKMKNIKSIPVGFLEIIDMHPLDFEEFIKALSVSDKTISILKEAYQNETKVDDIMHRQMMNLFNLYLVVGGMPKAVQIFIDTKDINRVNIALKDIDDGYILDISKYDSEEKLLIQDIYDLIPSELNAQNKRFILKNLNEKARFYQYETSFTWLKNSGVGLFVHNVDNPVYPLLASKERTLFKLFLCDVGLLSYKLFNGKQIVLLNGNTNVNYGALYEAVAAQELEAHNYSLYYNSDKKRGEIDFLIEENDKIVPIEVKSGKDYKRHSALNQLLNNKEFNIEKAIVLCNGNLHKENKRLYLPIYMIMFMNNEIYDKTSIVDIDISKLI